MVDLFGCSSVLRNRSIRLYFLFLRPPKNFFSIFIFEAQAKQHLCWHSFTRVTLARCDFKACVCNLLSKHYVHILVIDVFYALSLTPHHRGTAVMLILVVVVFVKKNDHTLVNDICHAPVSPAQGVILAPVFFCPTKYLWLTFSLHSPWPKSGGLGVIVTLGFRDSGLGFRVYSLWPRV